MKEFVNVDEIAKGLSPFNPEGVAIEAGRLMLKRIDELLDNDETFSIETTLATKSYIKLVRRAQAKGYLVHILFFWLNSVDLAKSRVAKRVSLGGHNIPPEIIERRYKSGIRNLFDIFMREIDIWTRYDNSNNKAERIAFGGKKVQTRINNKDIFKKIKEL